MEKQQSQAQALAQAKAAALLSESDLDTKKKQLDGGVNIWSEVRLNLHSDAELAVRGAGLGLSEGGSKWVWGYQTRLLESVAGEKSGNRNTSASHSFAAYVAVVCALL